MENNYKENFIKSVIYYTFIFIIIMLCFYSLRWFWPFLGGLALAYVFVHIAAFFSNIKFASKFATISIAIIFYALCGLLFWSSLTIIAGNLVELSSSFPSFYKYSILPITETLAQSFLYLVNLLAPSTAMSVSEFFVIISNAVNEIVTSFSSFILVFITNFLTKLPMFFIGFIFMLISSFYIGLDYKNVTQFILKQVPKKFRPIFIDVKDFLVNCIFRLLKSYIIIMLITFFTLALGLWALRVDGFIKIAAITAILDILPLIGSGGVLIPWGIYYLLIGNTPLGTGVLILYLVITIVRNIMEPRVIGEQLGLNPLVSITAIFFGIQTMGIVGIFVAPVGALLLKHLNQTGAIKLFK